MLASHLLWLTLLPVLAASTQAALAQSEAGGYRIAGRVVDAESGAPLAGAAVAIVGVVSGPRRPLDDDQQGRRDQQGRARLTRRVPLETALQSATTAEDGSFHFEHLPAGKYSLNGTRRGYIESAYQQHGFYSTAIVAGPNLPTEGLTFRLSSGAVISGTLTESSGEPVELASVTLYRVSDDGLNNTRTYRTGMTDDIGSYEFAHLPAGTYFVSATAQPWYASSQGTQAMSADPNNAARPTAVSATTLDVAYPRSFYADATNSDAATPIPVRGGEHLRIDLHMQAVPAVHLTLAMPPETPGERPFFSTPMLTQDAFGDRSNSLNSAVITRTDEHGQQSMSISVPPGEYDVEFAGRSMTLQASGNEVPLDTNAGTPFVRMSGQVAAATGATLPGSVYIALQAMDAQASTTNTAISHDGSFSFDHLRPGTYEVTALGEGGALAVVQVAAQGAQLDGRILKVGSQPITLAATLAPASTVVAGFTRQGGAPASGMMIVLVPQHLRDHALYRRDQSDSDGSFSLRDVAAGKYTVVSIADGWDLEWARPEVIAHYLPGGQPLTVASGNRATVQLEPPVQVQSR